MELNLKEECGHGDHCIRKNTAMAFASGGVSVNL